MCSPIYPRPDVREDSFQPQEAQMFACSHKPRTAALWLSDGDLVPKL